jgi:hypothetical protein
MQQIIEEQKSHTKSKQIWIAKLQVKVWWTSRNIITTGNNTQKEIMKAIIYWCLPEIVKKTK